jgi:hypothetical protein
VINNLDYNFSVKVREFSKVVIFINLINSAKRSESIGWSTHDVGGELAHGRDGRVWGFVGALLLLNGDGGAGVLWRGNFP